MFFKSLPTEVHMKAEYWVKKLAMEKHPEGGYFVQTFKSYRQFVLPGYEGSRSACTVIYYLLKSGQFSAFHKMKSDETWHFYAGGPLALYIIDSAGNLNKTVIGRRHERGHVFQATVEGGSWFAASVVPARSYSLVGCTVAPGFDYRDWELGDRNDLAGKFPRHRKVIERYTR